MIQKDGWTRLGAFSYHYCRLDSVSSCGRYQALCGVKGWVEDLVPIAEALPWCNNCVRALDQKQFDASTEVALDRSPGLPPNQLKAKRWPVLHLGSVPLDAANSLSVNGAVEHPLELTFEELLGLPQADLAADMHCIMRWTVKGIKWRGVAMATIIEKAKPTGKFVLAHGANDYFTNLAVEDAAQGLVAFSAGGQALEGEHGGPIRLVIPHLYAWKSVKWLSRLEFVETDQAGTWEQRGLHNRGDVWAEERFAAKGTE